MVEAQKNYEMVDTCAACGGSLKNGNYYIFKGWAYHKEYLPPEVKDGDPDEI